jgi:hypothetical protein
MQEILSSPWFCKRSNAWTPTQDNECDLLEAIKESKTVIEMLRAERQDESV